MNTTPQIIKSITQRAARSRFDPLRNLTPDLLSRQLDAFESGYLRDAVETWDAIEKRDDLLKSVISKRKKSISRHGWDVFIPRHTERGQMAEASAHKQALENFYRNLTCTNAIDANERGAFKLLIRQMMDSVGKRYAVHEIVWNPAHENGLTAEFRFVPLSFFENTTGQLRFLNSDGAMEGEPLEPGAWLVTTGEGLMVASSVAWMFKNLSLKDWLDFSQHHGTPGLQGTTNAARDSDDWNALVETVSDLLDGKSVVTNATDSIKILDLAQSSQIPYPALTERMDRTMAGLWRGADLSTLSREHGYGASLQDRESCLLEEDDCEVISETLNAAVDTWVIGYLFGKDAKPLARVRVLPAPRECSEYDLRVDQFLLTNGAPLSLKETLERYGRELPEPGDAVLQLNKSASPANCSPGSAAFQAVPAGIHPLHPPQCYGGRAQCCYGGRVLPASPNCSSGGDDTHLFPSTTLEALKNQSVVTSTATENCENPNGVSELSPGLFHSPSETTLGNQTQNLSNPEGVAPSAPERNLKSPISNLKSSAETISNVPPTQDSGLRTLDSTPFTLLQGDWIQISPLGDFPHGEGIQRVDSESIATITRQFNSLLARLGRLFVGVPFYIGHPDVPSLAREFPDRKAYGWITALEAGENGLLATVKWSHAGRTLLEQAHYKFLSPYWEADPIGTERGRKIFRPKRLISVGLTNQPNIPVLPLANNKSSGGDDTHLSSSTTLEALKNQSVVTSTATENCENPNEVSSFSPGLFRAPCKTTLGNNPQIVPNHGGVAPAATESCNLKSPISNLKSFSAETVSCVSPQDSGLRTLDLGPTHTESLTNDLGRRHSQRGRALSRQTRIQELVSEKMSLGNSYDRAWATVKEQHPALFNSISNFKF